MEEMVKKQSWVPNSTSSALAMHKDSKTISKVKPKIRIIHIFAPEIIKTDVANFRELVQRLTGKPTEKGSKNKKPRINARREEPRSTTPMTSKKMELRTGYRSSEFRERIKEEEEMMMWRSSGENSGGFLGGFADLDGFTQELGEFPLLPFDASHHMDAFGETQLV